jgi:subtilisin family serine protease
MLRHPPFHLDRILRALALAALLAGLAAGAGAAGPPLSAQERSRIEAAGFADAPLLDALEREGRVQVLIGFSPPGRRGRIHAARRGDLHARRAIAETADRILAGFAPGEFELHARFRSLSALAGSVDARGLVRLFRNPAVVGVARDQGGRGQLVESIPLARLDTLQGMELTGAGVTVGILDSGLDTDHPDLVDDLVAERCFCDDPGAGSAGCCPDGTNDQSGAGSAEDDHGHGTNVTGIVTSRGTIAPLGGAPDAAIVVVKVLDQNNQFSTLANLTQALDYLHNLATMPRIVNMSLGTTQLYSGECDLGNGFLLELLAGLAQTMREDGALLFASSMNDRSGTQMGAPACFSSVISVGAVYDADLGSQTRFLCTDPSTAPDQVTCWSNSNAVTDLFAPGALVTSTGIGGGTSTFAGTSQASPLAAACAALLLEADPTLTPDQVEVALKSSSTTVTDPKNGLSFPRLDCEEALESLGVGECDDGIDNDGDGLTDHPADPGCDAAGDASENSPQLPCDDGLDNDGDGLVDYPDDLGCRDLLWWPEDPACSDGVDNDGDGLIDWDGGDPPGDPDPNCIDTPWKKGEVPRNFCGLGFEPALALLSLCVLRSRSSARRTSPGGPSAPRGSGSGSAS